MESSPYQLACAFCAEGCGYWRLESFSFPFSSFYFLVRQRRAELAGGESVEGAEAGGEFGGSQATLAVEPAEKIVVGLVGVARRHVAGEAGFDVTYLRRRSERRAVRPILPLTLTLNLR